MHDVVVRIASLLLVSGVLLVVTFYLYSLLYPRRVAASGPVEPSTVSAASSNPATQALEWALRQVEARVTRGLGRDSWGWAIVFTTTLLNALLLPFRILAARHASAMQVLQPKLEEINSRFKAKGKSSPLQMDPEQSREIAELYKEHKTHPLSGCVPSLAPFLILAGFYSVLTRIGELHGAHWLWIADLSRPEQLPLRILPVLMIASQLLLGKMNPTPGVDPNMNRMMTVMSVVFGIAFYGQPSALMLYWVTSNLLGIAIARALRRA